MFLQENHEVHPIRVVPLTYTTRWANIDPNYATRLTMWSAGLPKKVLIIYAKWQLYWGWTK